MGCTFVNVRQHDRSNKKSTTTTARSQIADGIWLDGRLAIWNEASKWLALGDIHFGYELARKVAGGLFPNWGMAAIEERLFSLLDDYAPRTLILNGDIIDASSVGSAGIRFLEKIRQHTPGNVVFVEGNHDRGTIKAKFDWVPHFEIDGFLFHHGHCPVPHENYEIEVVGHHHPSISLRDGAGLSLKIVALVQETYDDQQRWIMPAFSPWAGGGKFAISPDCSASIQWACSPKRVFEIDDSTLLSH